MAGLLAQIGSGTNYKREFHECPPKGDCHLFEPIRYSLMYACGRYIENNPVKAGVVDGQEDWEYSSSRYYLRGRKDELVDGYEGTEVPVMPEEVDIHNEEFFEKGLGIGPGFFRFQLAEKLKVTRRGDE